VWALVPLISFGLATPAVFVYAAVRLKSLAQWLAVALYTVVLVLLFAVPDYNAPDNAPISTGEGLAFTAWFLVNVLGGTAHAFAIRRRLFDGPSGGVVAPGAPAGLAFDNAVAMAAQRDQLREKARAFALQNPLMAQELRIGRPDLPRVQDDGGLIDINHAPPPVLATLPGITPDLVARIVEAREQVGTFVSAEELSATAGLPPRLTPALAEYGIYLP
jgi:hypothetical protein